MTSTATVAAAVAKNPASMLRIGMIGAGTVGGGVYELISKYYNDKIEITKICVNNLDKVRDFNIDTNKTVYTTDPSTIYNDPTIHCIVEVMGGTGIAKDIVLNSIKAGKSIVTANKALLAEYMNEVQTLFLTAKETNKNIALGYEAAVCGGIPIINILQTAYTADTIRSIMGICNGTTNYMLSAMMQGGSYDEILKQAQHLGFAEADPSADVEGYDVRSKIALLAKLAYGITISDPVQQIPCRGITQIIHNDIEYAQQKNYTIKLLGVANRSTACEDKLSVYVTPMLVPTSHMIGGISGAGNCVAILSSNMGLTAYSGPGAGRYPTANSVVADIVRIYNSSTGNGNSTCSNPFPIPASTTGTDFTLDSDYTASAWYVRLLVAGSGQGANTDIKDSVFYKSSIEANIELDIINCSVVETEDDGLCFIFRTVDATTSANNTVVARSQIETWIETCLQSIGIANPGILIMPIL